MLTEKDRQRAQLEREKLAQRTIINKASHEIEQINKRIKELEESEEFVECKDQDDG
jgi:tetrahydromethanopterin S-methyltransferase subunit G